MILRNPTKIEISINYKDEDFILGPEATIEVSEEVGNFWLSIHQFLEISNKVEVKETKEEVKELKEVTTKKAKK